MAQQTFIRLTSDISGKVIPEGEGETITFAFDGKAYEMDLTNEEAQEMRGIFGNYAAMARRAGRGTGTGSRKTAVSSDEAKRIRAWAEENGIEVNARGRISSDLRDKWLAAIKG